MSAMEVVPSSELLSVKGQIAIVTGSGRPNGIGAAVAYALAAHGAKVCYYLEALCLFFNSV